MAIGNMEIIEVGKICFKGTEGSFMKDGVPPHHTGMSQDMDIEYSNEARNNKASEKSVYQRPDGMMDDHIVNNVYIKKK